MFPVSGAVITVSFSASLADAVISNSAESKALMRVESHALLCRQSTRKTPPIGPMTSNSYMTLFIVAEMSSSAALAPSMVAAGSLQPQPLACVEQVTMHSSFGPPHV